MQSLKINPQFSVANQKNQLKGLSSNVQTMRNRVQLLRQQLQKQKDTIKKHKNLTKQVIQKKVQVNKINQWKQKDNSQQMQKIEYLKKRNQQMRLSHQQQLQNIQKAIYLVKLDDARQVKNISMEHNKRLKEMQQQFLSNQQQRKRKVHEESQAAKERYMKYWKQKLANIYTEQAQTIVNVAKDKQQAKKQLQKLEQEEIRLMEQINKHHSQGVQTKKQYLAALSLPVKEVAEAMNMNKSSVKNDSLLMRRKSMNLNNSTTVLEDSSSQRYLEKSSPKIPNAQVNQDKLKIVLQQLKKIDRNSLHTSR